MSRASRIRVDAIADGRSGSAAAGSTVHRLRAEVALLRDELAQAQARDAAVCTTKQFLCFVCLRLLLS